MAICISRLFYLTNNFMFKCINKIASEYFNEYFTHCFSIYPGTRNFDKLQLPQVRTETVHTSFHFKGPTLSYLLIFPQSVIYKHLRIY